MTRTSHLKALLRKNWIIWKRSWFISLLEVLVPVAFSLLLILLKNNSSPISVPTMTYYNTTAFPFDQLMTSKLFKNCKSSKNGGLAAIVPDPSKDTLAYVVDQALRKGCF